MSIFKCKMCGGTIEFEQGATVGVCDSCGTKQTLPRLDDDRKANLYDRANHFRRNNDFDKAMGIYETILNEDNTDAEAYWSLVLCRYGIEYVEDPDTHKRIPTVNRAQYTSIFMDEDYKSAIKHADGYQKEIYEQEAKAIDEIQKGILEISRKEEPFDCFISFKETDANGRRTRDAVLAQDLYNELTKEGFKVFFAPVTLEDKLGTAYEPYIFAALNSSKVMVVLGTKPENFNAVWVKNEWSRYLALIKNGAKKTLIPAYRDMDPYDLPEEFSHLMAQDMSKLGFMQDLIRGIKKLLAADEPKAAVKETVVVNGGGAAVEPLLTRAFMFLEDGNWKEADKYCEKVLDKDPKNAQAYLGKLMAECKVCRKEDFKDCRKPFDGSDNFKKVVRFGDKQLGAELNGYIAHINERNDFERKSAAYKNASSTMNKANSEGEFRKAAETFAALGSFKSAEELYKQCLEKAEECQKKAEECQKVLEDVRSKFNDPDCTVGISVDIWDRIFAICSDDTLLAAGWYLRSEWVSYIPYEIHASCDSGRYGGEFKLRKVREVYSEIRDLFVVHTDGTAKRYFKSEDPIDISHWKNVISITDRFPGHGIVGLRADGTLAFCDGVKICNELSQWTNITSVYSKGCDFFGICKDGTVKYFGENSKDWRYITAAKNVVRLKYIYNEMWAVFYSDGSAEIVKRGSMSPEMKWEDVVEFDILGNGEPTVLQGNGKVLVCMPAEIKFKSCNEKQSNRVAAWTDIVSICAGDHHVVGLKRDGTVVAELYKEITGGLPIPYCGQCDVSDWKNIIAVYAGLYFTIGVRADGSVVHCGSHDIITHGWSDLDWKLFDGVKDLEENIKRNKEFKASVERAAEEQREARKRAEEERKRAAEEARLARIAELEKEKEALQAEMSTIKGLFAAGKIKKLQARVDEIETELTKLK